MLRYLVLIYNMFDKFKNSERFKAKCHETGEKCPVCGSPIIEVERKKLNERVTSLFGYFCTGCDYDMFSLLEWAIKNQSK